MSLSTSTTIAEAEDEVSQGTALNPHILANIERMWFMPFRGVYAIHSIFTAGIILKPYRYPPQKCNHDSLEIRCLITPGDEEGGAPSRVAHNGGPSFSKRRSARRLSTMPLSRSSVAKLDLKAISPGSMCRPAPMLSKAPRPR